MIWDESPRDPVPTQGLPIASPANMLPVRVIHREEIAPGVVSVFIVLPGTEQAPAPYLPGQFVTLALPTPRQTLYRSYSLCGDGDPGRPWELTIKRMEMGAVSTYFFQKVQEGTLLYSSLPRGTFTLPAGLRPDSQLMMVATGSGITPIMGMLRALALMHPEERPLVQLHYASKSPREIIFGDELADMDPDQTWLRQWHYLSSRGKRMSADVILERAGKGGRRAHWYMCGADALKRELQEKLSRMGVPERQVHSEVFATQAAPAYRVAASTGGSLRVAETGATLDVQPNETILAALERHGYRPSFSCRVGACGQCRLKVLEGKVDPVGEVLTPADKADGFVLSCIAQPMGAVVLASGGKPPAGVARVAAVAGASGRSGGAVTLTRLVSLVGIGTVLLGAWNLTDHYPSALAASSGPVSTPEANPSGTNLPGTNPPGPSPTPVQHRAPTPTTTKGSPGSPPPPTPVQVAPTPKPAPTPTACTRTTPPC